MEGLGRFLCRCDISVLVCMVVLMQGEVFNMLVIICVQHHCMRGVRRSRMLYRVYLFSARQTRIFGIVTVGNVFAFTLGELVNILLMVYRLLFTHSSSGNKDPVLGACCIFLNLPMWDLYIRATARL